MGPVPLCDCLSTVQRVLTQEAPVGGVSRSWCQVGSAGVELSLGFRVAGASHRHWVLSTSSKKPQSGPRWNADGGIGSDRCAIRRFPSRRRLSKGPGTKLPYRFPVRRAVTNLWKAWPSTLSDTQIESEGRSSCRCTARQQVGGRGSMGYELSRDIRGVVVLSQAEKVYNEANY